LKTFFASVAVATEAKPAMKVIRRRIFEVFIFQQNKYFEGQVNTFVQTKRPRLRRAFSL
jgi:hypothetical protein